MSASGTADGPRQRICGEWIGRAEELIGSGPWYVDASAGNPATITATAGSSGTWVRVSGDCARGARVSMSDPAVLRVIGVVPAEDGTDAAVLVNPESAGRAVLTATMPGTPARTVTFAIGEPAVPS
ncbi:MAG TPA: hypothetical protein VH373_16845 [Jatrophihabitantaceae bacterium]